MATKSSPANKVSSPASTGGAGTFFEQHVHAYWLAQLLVRAVPPILRDCAVVEVHLQNEHLGLNTDDLLIVGENGAGERRRLVGQVKRTFTVSASDGECKKAIQDYWKDFSSGQVFSPAADRFALITLRGTNTLLEHFAGLLDCARAARDAGEFEHRLATPGFLSAKAVEYCGEVRAIVGEREGRSVSAGDVWGFLRVLHVLSLDLNSATGQAEAAIKSLLAHTATEPDALGAAESSWDALLREVGDGMPQARSFRRDDLPEAVRRRHSPVGGAERRALRALGDHSALILGGIRSTIGKDLHLVRGRLVQEVIERLESAQVVLVSGPAGSGKSGVAKDAVGVLSADHFAFGFRAEELATAHLDETLQRSQVPATAAALGAILAAQGRKVLLVESVERLLEAPVRDAFTDLLTLVANDRAWRLVLTCRDYSADLVRACFLAAANVGHAIVTVPALDDEELRAVEGAYPALARPLANAALRRLLRSPYVLDKALQIRWEEERPLPRSEREFRALFWREIVRAEHRAGGGMPRRREEAFVQVALRRARALTLHAPCADLDADVIEALRRDSLIAVSGHSSVLAAPAHDVLEDWAILRWIDEQHAVHDGSSTGLSAALGTHPAVRRTYRKWVGELAERDAAGADGLFQAVMRDGALPAQFRDDTLASLLRSPASAAFLERHRAELFAADKQLLRRVIHLLRVACVTAPAWLGTTAPASLFNVPDGPAWACVLRLVQANLGSFDGRDRGLLLGLVEDWARGVSWQSPHPEGAEPAAAIAHHLLPALGGYLSDDERKRALRVIAKVPNAAPERFSALLLGTPDEEEEGPDRASRDLREVVFEGVEGMPAARDLPGVIVAAARDYLLCSEADLRGHWGYSSDLGLEALFGVRRGRSHDFFPASAFRGPFLPLLRHHPREGLDLLITVFNHSADWYAHPRVRSEYVEPPFEMRLTLADGTSRAQWCNGRLWLLYRGLSVGPYVLQCLLMALERWLLEFAKAHPGELDAVLLDILRRSDCAALTAVAASVATAFPHASGEALLTLLRSSRCILLDRDRLAHESHAPSNLHGLLPRLDSRNKLYEDERKEADRLPHRRHDLEMAIANLQLGPLAPRVHEALDRHRAELPPVKEQDEEQRIWRLALHRMDLRQYTVAEDSHAEAPATDGGKPPEDERGVIRLDLKAPEPDVKEMADRSEASFRAMNARAALLMWGRKVFGREEGGSHDPRQWRQRLQEARAASDGHTDEELPGRGGPGYAAAVCVRDHWEEMSDNEREWCTSLVCAEVARDADLWARGARLQRFDLAPDRPCAWVLPLLLGKSLPDEQQGRVRRALALALTHALDEVRWYAARGIGANLWGIDRDLALRCVNALALEATLVQRAADRERRRPYEKRRQLDDIEAEAAARVRRRFRKPGGIADDAWQAMDAARWFGAEAAGRMLAILSEAPAEHAAVALYERVARILVGWWDADDRRRRKNREGQERTHEAEAALTDLLESFLLRTSAEAAELILQPILEAVDRHPREAHWLLQGLIGVEDRRPNTAQFWSLWRLFAERARHASWLPAIDDEHPTGSEMISAVFLGSWWKDEVRHWRSLEGHEHNVHALFEGLPPSSTILDDYVRFLYHVGERSLPGAFGRIAKRLQQGDPARMLRQGNTVYLLEVLLQRHVYGRPLELKRRGDLREAVLFLLDALVERGSSAAFRMRDDFVTPVPAV
jgi:hypothetical protein